MQKLILPWFWTRGFTTISIESSYDPNPPQNIKIQQFIPGIDVILGTCTTGTTLCPVTAMVQDIYCTQSGLFFLSPTKLSSPNPNSYPGPALFYSCLVSCTVIMPVIVSRYRRPQQQHPRMWKTL